MSYSDNLLLNGNLEYNALTDWTVSNIEIGAIAGTGEKYFKLATTASMFQSVSALAFLLQPLDCLVSFKFRLEEAVEATDSTVDAYVLLEYHYEETDVDVFALPIIQAFLPSEEKNDGVWYSFACTCPLKVDAILQYINVSIITKNLSASCFVREVNLQRNLDPTEAHNNSANPHNLPLAISVGQEGIKAVLTDPVTHEVILNEYGQEQVQFWLKADGSAYFFGEMYATSGRFGTVEGHQIIINADGTVTIPMLTITGLGDYTDTIDDWKMPGSTTIDGANIETGTVAASKIKTEQLIVGVNIQMGPGAIITWENLTEDVQSRLGVPGPPGPEGPPGDPADADIPNWIYEWNSGNTVIANGYILTPQMFIGHGGQVTDGIKVDENGIVSYKNTYKNGFSLATDGTLELYSNNVLAAEMLFDNRGAGTLEEDENRVFIGATGGYALKIQTEDANMSIVAGGTIGRGYKTYIGDVVFMGTVEGIGAGGTAVFG